MSSTLNTVALGVSPDSDGNGVTPLVHRKTIGAQWNSTGIITGLDVTGTAGLSYNVSEGVAVCQKGAGDGKTLAYWPGGDTPDVAAGDPSNPRIDAVWVTAHNRPEYSDPDNFVGVGVTQGAPAASPTAPQVPAGCQLLRCMWVPAGMTDTRSCTQWSSAQYAVMVGGNLGKLGENWCRQTKEGRGHEDTPQLFYELPITFNVPTDRMVEALFQTCFSAKDNQNSEWAASVQLDGRTVEGSTANFVSGGAWTTHEMTSVFEVTAGTHTVRMCDWTQNGSAPVFHYGPNRSGQGLFVGQRLQLFDRGAVA